MGNDSETVLLLNFNSRENISNNEVVLDESKHHNNGVMHGFGHITDDPQNICGRGLYLALPDYITVQDSESLRLQNSFTIEVWARGSQDSWYVLRKIDAYGFPKIQATAVIAAITKGYIGSYRVGIVPGSFELEQLHYYVLVRDQAGCHIYIDGKMLKEFPCDVTGAIFGSNELLIGATFRENYNPHFSGMIYALRISQVARGGGEIFNNYIRGK